MCFDYLGATAGGIKYLKEKYPELRVPEFKDCFINGFAAHVLELEE